jgi:hypothetical protein
MPTLKDVFIIEILSPFDHKVDEKFRVMPPEGKIKTSEAIARLIHETFFTDLVTVNVTHERRVVEGE